jgi:2-keto-4-pentenoate hydratase/2-oxohepta-3-ene-1,7-dioic acid hydratase in catechol pathway
MSFGIATLLTDDGPVLAVMQGVRLVPLRRVLPDGPSTFEELLDNWEELISEISTAMVDVSDDAWSSMDDADLGVPGVTSPAVWCAGANFADHIEEMGAKPEKRPYHFLVPTTTLSAHGQPVRRPQGVTMLDWEVELVAVIGRGGRDIPVDQALDHVAGYTVANDVSVRDPELMRNPFFGIDWIATKSGDGLTPLGPAIVPRRFVPDIDDLRLRLTVNGNDRQNSTTAQMIVTLAEQISALTRWVTLRPGDLVLTGTPAGTAAAHGVYLSRGDVMVAEVEGVGRLVNAIV